ncbi:helix-turn-helix domain-containing protein [Parabacteroides sp. OttesenSCG-928-K15]|nr:helix-turn-helix domain-containing protein [Parabacteroides sp. OttesenSCG-928-K15]
MKLITIDSEVYKSLVRKLDRIYNYIEEKREKEVAEPDPSGVWIYNEDAAAILEVSLRTLQRMRSKGEITYSIRGGKVRYRLSEVQRLIPGRIIASKYQEEADLKAAHLTAHEKRKTGHKRKE